MTRTIGRRLRHDRRSDDFEATCDYCGVVYLHSQLREDAAGHMRCPKDQPGLDVVTLSQIQADHIAQEDIRPVSYSGNWDTSLEEWKEHPVAIMGTAKSAGWWHPERGARFAPTQANWRNSVTVYKPFTDHAYVGDVGTPEAAEDVGGSDGSVPPTYSNPDVTFAGQWLVSHRGLIVEAETNPCLWAVASIAPDSAQLGGIVALTNGTVQGAHTYASEPVDLDYVITIRYDSSYRVYGVATYLNEGGQTTVTGPIVDDEGLHLFGLRMEDDALVLKIDSVEYSEPLSASGDSLAGNLDFVFLGGGYTDAEGDAITPHEGKLNQVYLSDTVPTATELASLETWFSKQYSELSL